MSDSLCECVASAELSIAYSEAVAQMVDLREGSLIASIPLGKRVAVQMPEAQWLRLAAAISRITGADVV